MKKINITLAAILSIMAIACNKEEIAPENSENPSEEIQLVEKTFYATYENNDDTKVAVATITSTNVSLKWQDGDKVYILTEGQELKESSAANNINGSSAKFDAFVTPNPDAATTYYAVYPASAVAQEDTWVTGEESKKALRVTIPDVQDAVDDSFDPKAYVATATTSTNTLTFSPIVSAIKFNLGSAASEIEKVIFQVNESTNIAGTGYLYTDAFTTHDYYSGGKYTAFSEITLNAPSDGFKSENHYYITFRPNKCEKGITLYFVYKDNTVKKVSSSKQLFTNKVLGTVKNLGDLSAHMKDANNYETYNYGGEIKFGDRTIDKATYGPATLINASSASKSIASTGVYFIDPAVEDASLNSSVEKLVVSSINNTRVKISKSGSVSFSPTSSSDYFIMANINYEASNITSNNVFSLYSKTATEAFETIGFYNVGIEVPTGKNIVYSNQQSVNICMDSCDIKLNSETTTNYIFQFTATNTFNSVILNNNVIWCNGERTNLRLFYANNSTIQSLEVCKNTVAGVYCNAASGYVVSSAVTSGKVKGNCFLIGNYATNVGASYTGIICVGSSNVTSEPNITFSDNLAYYSDSVPTQKLKPSYRNTDSTVQMKNVTEYPAETSDYTNGIFTMKSSYSQYGATR